MNEDTRIKYAEKRIIELLEKEELKKIPQELKEKIAYFYEERSKRRLETAILIFNCSKEEKKMQSLSMEYSDYSESVAAAYYAMYYIVHAYLAKKYSLKLKEDVRGVHAITHNLILYYLVKTKKLAKHLYEEYLKTLETAAETQKLDVEDFEEQAQNYAGMYEQRRKARENFTYQVTRSVEAHHAEQAISIAKEFIGTIREIMIK